MTTADTDQSLGNVPANQEPVATQETAVAGTEALPVVDEKAMLMQRARLMGLNVSNNIGLETLRQRIQDHLDGKEKEKPVATPLVDPALPKNEPGKTPSLRQHLYNDAMKLVRIRITNLDPKKKDLHGEIITVANEHLGTVKKFVPYGEVTDNGYHVPNCIYMLLKNRKFLNIRTRKDKSGQITVEQNWAQEFAIEVLPPMTQEELDQLKTAQLASGSLN